MNALELVMKYQFRIVPPGMSENEAWNVWYYDDLLGVSDNLEIAIADAVKNAARRPN